MLVKFRIFTALYNELGWAWLTFRVTYALRFLTGFIRFQMPSCRWDDRPLETWLKKKIPSTSESYSVWRKQNAPSFFFDDQITGQTPWNEQVAIDEARNILSGKIKYFAHEFHEIGFPPNWHADPISGVGYPANKHWSHISDDGATDIKFVWEANRFSMVYTLVRAYGSTQDEKYAEAFWMLILDWTDHNPPNSGVNWKDGQEISLRLMAWTFGYYAFFNSPSATPQRIAQFTQLVAAQAERIYKNIDYAISTHSNHTISEAFGLWLIGLLFPELKDSEKYFSLGRKILEEEANKQFLHDGSYSMYSLNYHRFVLHIYLYAMRLGELNNSPFSESVQRVVTKSIEYLSQLIDPQTGQMPVYGSNDGALILPLNNCDFTDYRPLLQLGSYITKKQFLFEQGIWDEDVFWLCGRQALSSGVLNEIDVKNNENSSVHLLHNSNSKAILYCADFQSRPSHSDQLHMDLWVHGQNIACDAGTYLYSGEGIWRNGLAHTSAHNTVTVDEKDQMTMVSRFTWTNWAKGKTIRLEENLWQGEHDGYKPVSHKRTVMALERDRWLVIDELCGNEAHKYRLHWLLNDLPFEQQENSILLSLNDMKYKVLVGESIGGTEDFSVVRAHPASTRGWRSRYYAHKEPALSLILEATQPKVCFWTFFGFESDLIQIDKNYLKIKAADVNLSIDLNMPI